MYTVAELSRLTGLPYMTVSNQMKRGWCAWPRRQITGITKNPAYKCWENMVQRATNKDSPLSKNYAQRGIDIHPVWAISFTEFLAHIGPRPSLKHSIDRIDNNKGYWPGNVRWALPADQARNKRMPTGMEKHGRFYRFIYRGRLYKFRTLEEAMAKKVELYSNKET